MREQVDAAAIDASVVGGTARAFPADMRLSEIMKSPVETIPVGQTIEAARSQMRRHRIHHLIVMDGASVVGVLSDRDLRGAAKDEPVEEEMAFDVVTAAPTTTVREAANLLRGHTIGCLPIVDGRKLVGMVTITDLLTLIGKGAERPVAESVRWTMKGRGPRRPALPRAR